MEPLRPRGAARRRLHDADLRQHADGPGGERAERTAQQLQDHVLRAAAAGGRSRSSTSTILSKLVEYGETGRVKLTTLTKEFFMPGFLERDEGEREPPCERIPGTASAASGRSAGSRRRRRSECINGHGLRSGGLGLSERPRRPIGPKSLEPMRDAYSCSAVGSALHESGRRIRSCISSTGEPIANVSRANGGLIQRDMRKAAAGARRAPRNSHRRADRARRQGGRALHERDAADGRRHAVARRIRRARSRPAPACPSTCAART